MTYVTQCKKTIAALTAFVKEARMPARTVVAVMLMIGMATYALPHISSTRAYYTDTEQSGDNGFAYGSVLISASGGTLTAPTADRFERPLAVSNDGSLPFFYDIITETNSATACAALTATLYQGATQLFSGPLPNMAVNDLQLAAGASDNTFNLVLEVIPGAEAAACDFDVRFRAWQEEMPGWDQGGFFHETTVATSIAYENNEGGGSAGGGDAVAPGDVVINEIMWAGSENDAGDAEPTDEWIELRNMTDQPIDISQWRIENAKHNGSFLTIPAYKMLPASGYFLIAHWPQASLKSNTNPVVDEVNAGVYLDDMYSDNGALTLKDASGTLIDETPAATAGSWPAGANESGKRWSMERNATPGDGTDVHSWHTCDRDSMSSSDLLTMKGYWNDDAQQNNCGTPKAANLSKNDPSASDYDPSAGSGGDGGNSQPSSSSVAPEHPGQSPEDNKQKPPEKIVANDAKSDDGTQEPNESDVSDESRNSDMQQNTEDSNGDTGSNSNNDNTSDIVNNDEDANDTDGHGEGENNEADHSADEQTEEAPEATGAARNTDNANQPADNEHDRDDTQEDKNSAENQQQAEAGTTETKTEAEAEAEADDDTASEKQNNDTEKATDDGDADGTPNANPETEAAHNTANNSDSDDAS